MDNITHTLIGTLVGRSLQNQKDLHRDQAILWTSIIGNNIGDLDSFFLWAFKEHQVDPHLIALLHHRGYTHTLLGALPLGLLSAWIGNRIGRSRSRPDLTLCLLGIGSVLLHIAADYMNNYGVHPFAPFFNQWIYGDTWFIVEPLIWMSLLPFTFFYTRSRIARGFAGATAALMVALLGFGGFTPSVIVIAVLIWFAGSCFAQRRLNTKLYKTGLAWLQLTAIFIAFRIGSALARNTVISELHTELPQSTINAVALSPTPANPFCWTLAVAGVHMSPIDPTYFARSGQLSLAPLIFSAMACTPPKFHPKHAGQSIQTAHPDSLVWHGEYKSPLKTFDTLLASSCTFKAFLQFARVPFWWTEGGLRLAADLRYDTPQGGGFTEVNLGTPCPTFLPPWDFPLRLK